MTERLPNNNETGWGDVLGAGDGSGGFLRVSFNDDGTLKDGVGGNVDRLDLGTVNAVDLLDGPVTLYTPAAGELVGGAFFRDIVFCDGSQAVVIYDDTFDPSDLYPFPPLAYWDSDLSRDSWTIRGLTGNHLAGMITVLGTVKASLLASGGPDSQPCVTWQANHAFDGSAAPAGVVAAGHVWNTSDTGDSGGSEPDWASNFGGSVVDGDLTWSDNGEVTVGSAHVYVDVAVPGASGGGGGGFAIGSSFLEATFPGGSGLTSAEAVAFSAINSAGSDIAINGGDNTLIDINTTGWYSLWASVDIVSDGGAGLGLIDARTVWTADFTEASNVYAVCFLGFDNTALSMFLHSVSLLPQVSPVHLTSGTQILLKVSASTSTTWSYSWDASGPTDPVVRVARLS